MKQQLWWKRNPPKRVPVSFLNWTSLHSWVCFRTDAFVCSPTVVFFGSLIPRDMNQTCTKFFPILYIVHAFPFHVNKIIKQIKNLFPFFLIGLLMRSMISCCSDVALRDKATNFKFSDLVLCCYNSFHSCGGNTWLTFNYESGCWRKVGRPVCQAE